MFDRHICSFFANAYDIFAVIHKDLTFGIQICFLISLTAYGFLIWQLSFSVFRPIYFEIVHVCIYTNAPWSVQLTATNKLHLEATFFLTFMIPLLFHVWQSYLLLANAYEVFTEIINISHWNCKHMYIYAKYYILMPITVKLTGLNILNL